MRILLQECGRGTKSADRTKSDNSAWEVASAVIWRLRVLDSIKPVSYPMNRDLCCVIYSAVATCAALIAEIARASTGGPGGTRRPASVPWRYICHGTSHTWILVVHKGTTWPDHSNKSCQTCSPVDS